LTPGLDEDRKELRAKAMLMAEATIALRCLREGQLLHEYEFIFYLNTFYHHYYFGIFRWNIRLKNV